MRRPDWFARPLAWFRDPFRLPAAPARSPGALPAYVALGHWGSGGAALEPRLEFLVAQLAAELSACQWCIHQGRHRWLKAFLPAELLGQVRSYETSGLFSERERAALALTEAVAHHTEHEPAMPQQAIARARRYFAEPELARIAAAAANEHFFDPATGAVGRDATLVSPSGVGGMPWRAIDAGISIRGLL